MEEKQFDPKSIIGYLLLFGIAFWFFYINKPTEEELEKQKQEQLAKEQEASKEKVDVVIEAEKPAQAAVDSLGKIAAYQKLGAFGFSQTLNAANGGETILENCLLYTSPSPRDA